MIAKPNRSFMSVALQANMVNRQRFFQKLEKMLEIVRQGPIVTTVSSDGSCVTIERSCPPKNSSSLVLDKSESDDDVKQRLAIFSKFLKSCFEKNRNGIFTIKYPGGELRIPKSFMESLNLTGTSTGNLREIAAPSGDAPFTLEQKIKSIDFSKMQQGTFKEKLNFKEKITYQKKKVLPGKFYLEDATPELKSLFKAWKKWLRNEKNIAYGEIKKFKDEARLIKEGPKTENWRGNQYYANRLTSLESTWQNFIMYLLRHLYKIDKRGVVSNGVKNIGRIKLAYVEILNGREKSPIFVDPKSGKEYIGLICGEELILVSRYVFRYIGIGEEKGIIRETKEAKEAKEAKKAKGLLTSIEKNVNLEGFTINYDGKIWSVKSDSVEDKNRNIVLKSEGEADKTIVINLSDDSVTIGVDSIGDPNSSILVSNPKAKKRKPDHYHCSFVHVDVGYLKALFKHNDGKGKEHFPLIKVCGKVKKFMCGDTGMPRKLMGEKPTEKIQGLLLEIKECKIKDLEDLKNLSDEVKAAFVAKIPGFNSEKYLKVLFQDAKDVNHFKSMLGTFVAYPSCKNATIDKNWLFDDTGIADPDIKKELKKNFKPGKLRKAFKEANYEDENLKFILAARLRHYHAQFQRGFCTTARKNPARLIGDTYKFLKPGNKLDTSYILQTKRAVIIDLAKILPDDIMPLYNAKIMALLSKTVYPNQGACGLRDELRALQLHDLNYYNNARKCVLSGAKNKEVIVGALTGKIPIASILRGENFGSTLALYNRLSRKNWAMESLA